MRKRPVARPSRASGDWRSNTRHWLFITIEMSIIAKVNNGRLCRAHILFFIPITIEEPMLYFRAMQIAISTIRMRRKNNKNAFIVLKQNNSQGFEKIYENGKMVYFSTVENLLLVNFEFRAIFVSCPVYTTQPATFYQK